MAEHSAPEILGFPNDARYHARQWTLPEPGDSVVFLRPAHRNHAPSRWCTGAYKFEGYVDYCADPTGNTMATETGWVDKAAFSQWISLHIGRAYIVGNEVGVINPVGDDLTATEYAAWYKTVWDTIKALDPTAKVGLYGPTQTDRERVRSIMETYYSLYGSPVQSDFYPLHYYLWPGFSLPAEIIKLEAHVAWFEALRSTLWNGPRNFWLAEFGMPTWEYNIDEAELLDCMNSFTSCLMTNTLGISLWAWWPDSEAALIVNDRKTALGRCYYNLATGKPCQ